MAGTVVICFTDIVGSTALSSRVGDDSFDELRRAHFDLLVRQVEGHGGEIVKNLGDGLMLSFGSSSDAVSAAVAMQRAVSAAMRTSGDAAIAMRVGISAGDASQEGGDWFGAPVVEGARLCAVAEAGQIVVSEVVRLLAGTRGGHEFRPLGHLELKGLPEPVSAAEVAWAPLVSAVAVPLPGALAPAEGELPFAARGEPLGHLRGEWKKAVAARESLLVMVAGEPGVGKTRLVSEFARALHADGAVVLLGRADENVDAPYGPWREALRALVRSASDDLIAAYTADFGGELARIVPEIARRVDGLGPPVSTDPDTERLLLFEAVAGVLAAMSDEAPVLLVLDDLHWADRSSLLLLTHVLKADRRAALLVVATYRDTDVDRTHPLSSVLADLRRLRGATRLSLSGLDEAGIASLLAAAGGHELDDEGRAFAAALLRETEGNPFFVGEVLSHLIETGALVQREGRWRGSAALDEAGLPEGVREVIGRRLADLPDVTNSVLGVGSVLGREFDVSMLATVAEMDPVAVLDALAVAERARMIGEVAGRPGRYSFSHALVRTTLADELGTNRRVRLHRAIGIALEQLSDPPLGELAFHFGEAAVMGETERAVRYAREAAEQALELAAPQEAASLVRSALRAAELGDASRQDRARLLLLLGRALDAVGDSGTPDAFAAAHELAVSCRDADTASQAAVAFGGFWIPQWHVDDRALPQLRAALELAPEGDSALRAELLQRLGVWLALEPGSEGARCAREGYEMAARVGSARVQQSAAIAVGVTLRNIDRDAQLAFAREALQANPGAFGAGELSAYAVMLEALLSIGDLDGLDLAVADLASAFSASPLSRLPNLRTWYIQTTTSLQMSRNLIAGRFDAVEALVAEVEAELTDTFLVRGIGAEFGRTQLAYFRGDWEDSSRSWERARSIVPGAIDVYFGFMAVGSPLPAVRAYCERFLETDRPEVTKASNVAVAAEGLRRIDAHEASAAYASEFVPHAGFFVTNGSAYFHGSYDTALGILFTTARELDRAVGYLEQGVELCDGIRSPSFGALARLELATTLRLRDAPGDDAHASEVARQALVAATELGMHGWVDRIERLQSGDLEWWRLPDDR